MSASIIVAYDKNRVIGHLNMLPWRSIPEDIQLFKERTIGHNVFMGRNTYESIPAKFRPLPARTNIVITSQPDVMYEALGGSVALPLYFVKWEAALSMLNSKDGEKENFVIGGEQIYKQAIEAKVVDTIYASVVDGEHEGDAFFPALGPEWLPVNDKRYGGFTLWEFRCVR